MQSGIPVNGGKSISFRRMDAVLGASYAAAYNSGGAYASGPLVLTEGTPGAAMDATWVGKVLRWLCGILDGPPAMRVAGANAL